MVMVADLVPFSSSCWRWDEGHGKLLVIRVVVAFFDLRRQDVHLRAGGAIPLRGSASGSNRPLPGAAKVAETRYRSILRRHLLEREPDGLYRLHYRRHLDQSGGPENGKRLQHRQPQAAAARRRRYGENGTRKELPRLHDGPVDHAVGHSDPVLQTVSDAQKYCKKKGLAHRTTAEAAADLIGELLPEGAQR